MGLAVLLAGLCVLGGIAVVRALRAPLSLAPTAGLAVFSIVTTWSGDLSTVAVGACAVAGAVVAIRERECRTQMHVPGLLLGTATLLPLAMLGMAFAGVEAPVSTHDGAFHVEAVDKLRLGIAVGGWYPTGFHSTVAAVLRFVPWIDTARGTQDAALGLAVLAPLAVFSLGLALGLDALVAAIGALVLALTWHYPYDYHLWAGWPQGMGILLLIGLLATALHWTRQPSYRLAALAGIFGAAIVLTHGTEVYSAVVVLAVVSACNFRTIQYRALVRQAPLAIGIAVVATGPYVATLLGWAGAGGSAAAGEASVLVDVDGRGDVLQFLLGITGAGAPIDLPLRIGLIGLGLLVFRARVTGALWGSFVALLFVNQLSNAPVVARVFAVTYPWLDHDRPRQVAVVFASLLCAAGVRVAIGYVVRLRRHLRTHPVAFRRTLMAFGLLAFFFAEGSAVSVYKRLTVAVAEQNVYTADDAAAMAWLRTHVTSDEVVANDLSGDAGIWAPYKAGVQILLPRSAAGDSAEREALLENLPRLDRSPIAENTACALKVGYVFHGAPPQAFDERVLPDRSALEAAPGLEEVFASGDAAIFRLDLPCEHR